MTGNGKSQQILIIDDDISIGAVLRKALHDLGSVEFRNNGADGIQAAGELSPDLIILDVLMPDLDGIEVCKSLKSNAATCDIPILILTAQDRQEDEEAGFDLGATDFVRKPISLKVLRARASNILSLRATMRDLERLSRTDSLTGAFNRRHFFAVADTELERFKRYGHPVGMIVLDVDHFKTINDTFGHAIGDQALQGFVESVRAKLRREDVLGRIGGEEFVVLCPETNIEGTVRLAERIRLAVQGVSIKTEAGPLSFTVSGGVSAVIANDETAEAAIARADKALYRAKDRGRNRIEAVM